MVSKSASTHDSLFAVFAEPWKMEPKASVSSLTTSTLYSRRTTTVPPPSTGSVERPSRPLMAAKPPFSYSMAVPVSRPWLSTLMVSLPRLTALIWKVGTLPTLGRTGWLLASTTTSSPATTCEPPVI